jgi:hypothetical protein
MTRKHPPAPRRYIQQAGDPLRQGLLTSTALESDGYGTMIRSGLQSLAQRIEAISKEAEGIPPPTRSSPYVCDALPR